jgi:hypothetical protein
MPPRVTEYPVVKGPIRAAKGHLGAFELTVDDFAQPTPPARGAELRSEQERRGRAGYRARPCGRHAAVAASDLREGYLRADPGDGPRCCARS